MGVSGWNLGGVEISISPALTSGPLTHLSLQAAALPPKVLEVERAMAALKRSGGEPCAFSPWVSSTAVSEPLGADTQPIFINPSRPERRNWAFFCYPGSLIGLG